MFCRLRRRRRCTRAAERALTVRFSPAMIRREVAHLCHDRSHDFFLQQRSVWTSHGYSKGKGCSLARMAFDSDLTGLSFNQPFDQCQTQTSAAARCSIDMNESAEYISQIFSGNAFASVADREDYSFFPLLSVNRYVAAAVSVANRVRQQVIKHAFYRNGVRQDWRQIRGYGRFQLYLFEFGRIPPLFHDRAYHL